MTIEELRKKRMDLSRNTDLTLSNITTIAEESKRVAGVANQSQKLLRKLSLEFEHQTGLNGVDLSFLFFATALQCARQYLLTPFQERLNDKEAAKKVKKQQPKETSNRIHQWYWPSLEEIQTSPVPYDAIYGAKEFDLGFNGHNHRYKTLGHDPLLGWVFGLANIVTSTMTTWDFQSFHIKTGLTANLHRRDKISNRADTAKVFTYTKERLLDDGTEGKNAMGVALFKHAIHLQSDQYSKAGLPIPALSTLSPQLSQKAAEYGVDMGNVATVGKQASLSILINSLIATIHALYYDPSKYSSWSLYEVKTRKILSYSNLIASSSNLLYVGVSKDVKKLDIGGLLVTLYRLVSDIEYIQKIKEEFVFGGFNDLIRGKGYDF
ncbi:hypothetical protein LC048_19755 [Mesobacillus subterraneus]|uniref:hypothetical protein n=1 Tax=Mesobacillus subterraneus TaxID=285983 RepID=UPI001CFD3756|nr:hypothetical protein [Mesobacillus subterraneus]WLR54629.1 hypothetical protein LC048_19755 [Mesobacillus subterraneus]